MYTRAATEADWGRIGLPVPCHDGSTVLAVVFESLVVLSAVSGSVGGGSGGSVPLWSCDGSRGMKNDLGTLGAGTNPSACG